VWNIFSCASCREQHRLRVWDAIRIVCLGSFSVGEQVGGAGGGLVCQRVVERPLLPECALVKKIYWEDARASWGARSQRIPFGREGNWVCSFTSLPLLCGFPSAPPLLKPRPRPSSLLNCFFCWGLSRKNYLPARTHRRTCPIWVLGVGWIYKHSYITFLTSETNAIAFLRVFLICI